MSDRTYKVAVIGIGMIGNMAHIPAWKALTDDVELVAVAILDAGGARQAPAKWDWCADEPGRLDNETRQRGHFL